MYPKVFVLQQLSEIVPISAIQSSRLLNLYRKMSVTRKFRYRVHEKMAVEMLYKLAFQVLRHLLFYVFKVLGVTE